MAFQVDASIDTTAVWQRHYATARGFRHWPSEELVRSVGDRRFGTVLDAGCGNGANLWFLAEHADAVVGVDGCSDALAAAFTYMRRRGVSDVVKLWLGDILRLPLDAASVDAVVDVYTSQHLPWSQHVAAFAEYRRVLRPGGWLFLQHLGHGTTLGPAVATERFTYDELPAFPGVRPVCVPDASEMLVALAKAGLQPTIARGLTRSSHGDARASYIIVEAEAA